MVVGEDLGTVTPTIKRCLAKAGIFSYRLLYFEKKSNGAFRSPDQYPENASVSVTTHDLPTLRGFWEGRDIALKSQLGLYPSSKDAKADRERRTKDRLALIKALKKETLLPIHHVPNIPASLNKNFCQAVYAYLAKTRSRMLIVPLEDLLGELETPNFPGIPEKDYPSWRMKINREIEGLASDIHLQEFSKTMNRYRMH